MADKSYASISGFECKISINGEPVGFAQNVNVNVSNNLDKFPSIGTRISKIKEGIAEISGNLSEGFINTSRMKFVLGYDPLNIPELDPVTGEQFSIDQARLPTFDLVFIGKTETQSSGKDKRGFICTVSGVKIDSWSVSINKDDFIIQEMDFIATDIMIDDEDQTFKWD